jgi:hypothetical protein
LVCFMNQVTVPLVLFQEIRRLWKCIEGAHQLAPKNYVFTGNGSEYEVCVFWGLLIIHFIAGVHKSRAPGSPLRLNFVRYLGPSYVSPIWRLEFRCDSYVCG